MKVLDFAWETLTNVGQRDYDTLRLILDEKLASPVLSRDKRGQVVKLPVPAISEDGSYYSLQGLRVEADERSWETLWRLFKASLYHTSLHTAYSDFSKYAGWAKGKNVNTATFCISLVEDLSVTQRAMKKWPGLLNDMLYANYLSALRMSDPDSLGSPALSYSTKLLLDAWGVNRFAGSRSKSAEDREAAAAASNVRRLVMRASKMKAEEGKGLLLEAAQEAYAGIMKRGSLSEIPYFPYTEAHGPNPVLDERSKSLPRGSKELLAAAYESFGLTPEDAKTGNEDALDAYHSIISTRTKLGRILKSYQEIIDATRLDELCFPHQDYGLFLRVRSDLSGPIKNIRDQLRLVKNILDETNAHESGQIDMQAAIQVIASRSKRTDIFLRDETVSKDEAWAILLDASKSVSHFAHEVKGIATCLTEVARELIPRGDQWGAYAFNNSLQIIKDFQEDYSIETRARIGGLEQRSATLLPDAMMAANRMMAQRPVDLRILVVVSDGYPTGYSDIEKKLVETVEEISRTGTLLIGVGIDSEAIEDYFTVNCVLDNPYNMMKSFVKAYLELSSMF